MWSPIFNMYNYNPFTSYNSWHVLQTNSLTSYIFYFSVSFGITMSGYLFFKKKYKSIGKEKYRKKSIPTKIRQMTWNKWIGEDIGKTKCLCCKETEITQMNFQAGHVKAESKGGKTTVNNLRPICSKCNQSMGTMNMFAYMRKYGLK